MKESLESTKTNYKRTATNEEDSFKTQYDYSLRFFPNFMCYFLDYITGISIMKFGKHHYRPLADGLTISESKINGLGLHTTMDWNAGAYLGETHVWSKYRTDWIRTPTGGFINHSENPNCYIHTDSFSRELYSVRPLKEGEEITVFYTQGYDDIIKTWHDEG